MINKVILVGNVGNDPDVRYVGDGVPVARVNLATSESYTNKQGERVENTEWHNIVLWRGLAKVVEEYVSKGTRLYIEGKLTHRSYEKDGETKYITEIVANEMKLLSRKSESSSSGKVQEPVKSQAPDIDTSPEEGDDLPF